MKKNDDNGDDDKQSSLNLISESKEDEANAEGKPKDDSKFEDVSFVDFNVSLVFESCIAFLLFSRD